MGNLEDIDSEFEKIEKIYYARSQVDPLLFLRGLKISSGSRTQTFENCIADFQRVCFRDLAPSLTAVQRGDEPPKRRFWIERTKGASKDTDIGICLLWLVAFPQRRLEIQVGAADKDQAGIVKRRIEDFLHYNPWLNGYVDVQNYRIKNKDGLADIEIVAADVAGSHGSNPDVLVLNELSHVARWEFVQNMLNNADKVPNGLVIIATNAGFKGTPAEVWRNNALKNPRRWTMHVWNEPAPWIRKEDVQDARSRNPPSVFNRLWQGRWASGRGDAMSEDAIENCFCLDGPSQYDLAWRYIAGLDLGVSHDHSGLAVVGINPKLQRVRLAYFRAWEPDPATGEVDLMQVEEACSAVSQYYHIEWFGYDPSQAKLMAQRLTKRLVRMYEVRFTPNNLGQMAQAFLQLVAAGKLECYDEDGRLRRDFGKFSLVERLYGVRLEALKDEYGHADVGTALVICLPRALWMLDRTGCLEPDDNLTIENVELTEEEVNEMPDELKEIYKDAGESPPRLEYDEQRKRGVLAPRISDDEN